MNAVAYIQVHMIPKHWLLVTIITYEDVITLRPVLLRPLVLVEELVDQRLPLTLQVGQPRLIQVNQPQLRTTRR